MKKFLLTAGLAYILAFNFLPTPVFGDEAGLATGQLIDEMTLKSSGTDLTAEGALPSKKQVTKNVETNEPVFSNPTSPQITKPAEPKNLMARLALSLLILAILGGSVYFFVKRWPGAQKLKQRVKMIEILNQQYLGPKKSLAVVRVAGEAVLIGVTDQNISLLKTLTLLDDDVPAETKQAQFSLKSDDAQKFKKALSSTLDNTTREDEFSMAGLKEIIGGKLKGMREF